MTVLLASGREADVYEAEPGQVLRRYRDGRPAADEAALMRTLHEAGYPVPAVHSCSGPDLVMERLTGPTMAEAALTGAMDATAAGTELATLHDLLHELTADSGRSMLHLDLHPLNVVLTPRGPVVIDWANARLGDPRLDVAMTALILAQVATTPLPELVAAGTADVTAAVRALLDTFVRAVSHSPAAKVGEAAARRRTDPHLTDAERATFGEAVALVRSL